MQTNSLYSWIVIALVLAGAACSRTIPASDAAPVGLSYKISTYAYAEYGEEITLIVGTRAAGYRASAEYMPVEIGVAYRGDGAFRLTRESFVLVDEQGNRYRMTEPRELLEQYDFLAMDRSALSEMPTIARTSFGAYRYYSNKFTPARSTSIETRSDLTSNAIELPHFFYMTDFIYFPKPSTGIKGHKFTLLLESESPGEKLVVDFLVN